MSTLFGFLALSAIVAVAAVALRRGRWRGAHEYRRNDSGDDNACGAAAIVPFTGSAGHAGNDCGPADSGAGSAGDCGGGGGGD